MNELVRITSEPGKMGGRPCIRGLRIRVVDVLNLLEAGLSIEQIVAELPDLEREDVHAALIEGLASGEAQPIDMATIRDRARALLASE